MKLWNWIFEFRVNRVKDNKRIEFLANYLINEMKAQ